MSEETSPSLSVSDDVESGGMDTSGRDGSDHHRRLENGEEPFSPRKSPEKSSLVKRKRRNSAKKRVSFVQCISGDAVQCGSAEDVVENSDFDDQDPSHNSFSESGSMISQSKAVVDSKVIEDEEMDSEVVDLDVSPFVEIHEVVDEKSDPAALEEPLEKALSEHSENSEDESRCGRKFWFVLLLLLLIILILAIVLPIVLLKEKGSDRSTPTPQTPATPVIVETACEMVVSTKYDECLYVADVLFPLHPLRTWDEIAQNETCQHDAISWLATTPQVESLTNDEIINRYAVGVAYCELNPDWKSFLAMNGRATDECFYRPANQAPSVYNINCQHSAIFLDGSQQTLAGTLAPEISMLSASLKELTIRNSDVPDTSGVRRLQTNSSISGIGGEIPNEFAKLSILEIVDLSSNRLQGSIPPGLVNPDMKELILNNNRFSGELSFDMESATNLETVDVSNNFLSGNLEFACGDDVETLVVADLEEVECQCCKATRPSPGSPSSAPTLAELPQCTGDANCEKILSSLEPVYPPQNFGLLEVAGTCQNIARDWLRRENYVDEFSEERIQQRYVMAFLHCHFNVSSWIDPDLTRAWLSNLHECDWFTMIGANPCPTDDRIRILRFPDQNITGMLPVELSMLTSLWEFSVSGNALTGQIPAEYANLTALDTLNLSKNRLTGTIPILTSPLGELLNLDLSQNNFTGGLPSEMATSLPRLAVLRLSGNKLNGTLPVTLVDLNLRELHLDHNNFVGRFASGIVSTRMTELHIQENMFIGFFPAGSYTENTAPVIQSIMIHGNNFTGSVDSMCALFLTSLLVFQVDLEEVNCTCCRDGNGQTLPPLTQSPSLAPIAPPPTPVSSTTMASPQPPVFPGGPTNPVPSTRSPIAAPNPTPAPVAPPAVFAINRPFRGRTATPLDAIEPNDCFFADNAQPHVLNQCQCFNQISILANDVKELYTEVLESISNEFYNGALPLDSQLCDPVNQALVWLSSGNTRDAGDLGQRFVLAVVFFRLNGHDWTKTDGWLSDESECTWSGVKCATNSQVSQIDLADMNAIGPFPSEIGRLWGLEQLALSRNVIRGTLPSEIFGLGKLERISAAENTLTGPLPSSIGLATSLMNLNIAFNDVTGKLPTEIGNAVSLAVLRMESNRLSGSIPTHIEQLKKLESLRLDDNKLFGGIPSGLVNLPLLRILSLNNTGVGGIVPKTIGKLTMLESLLLGDNVLTGAIPTELGLLRALEDLVLGNNKLSGQIPRQLGNLASLKILRLQGNILTGPIPTELGNIASLKQLTLDANSLTGSVPVGLCRANNPIEPLTVDCPTPFDTGIECTCCTLCRRTL